MHRQKGTSNIPDKGVRTKSWTRKGPLVVSRILRKLVCRLWNE